MNAPAQGTLLQAAIAIVEAEPHLDQEEIEEQLRKQFPGIQKLNHYANPAAEAMMRRIRNDEQARIGIAADRARLRAKGLPESLAERRASLPASAAAARAQTGDYDT